jgi:DNA repair exonuclease SbcCD nuclease subunit
MTRVIHTGDTHIGYQQYHSPERRQDFLNAFEAVVADAIDDDVDAVIHAGDLFHDRRPDLQDLLGTLAALRTLAEADIPFLAVVGNHESTRGGQWLDLFENLGLATRLGAEPYRLDDVAVYGLDHVPQSRRDDLDYDFEPHDAAHAVLVSHGLFTPFVHGNWDTETVLSESTVDFDALLLGDNHTPDTTKVADTWVTYCGSTERASASEVDDRGYNIVEFDDDVDIRRRSLDTREFAFVSVDLGAGEGIERVREQVRQYDLDDAVAIVEITGAGDPVTPASVEEFAAEAGALIARVTDRREIEEAEADLKISFADPDDAVRERVREMGLSTAARDVDETVRASKVADSNVREEVQTRVSDLLASDDEAFSPAEVVDPGDESETGDSGEADSTPTQDGTDSAESSDAAADTTDDTAGTNTTDDTAGTDIPDDTADDTGETDTADDSDDTADATDTTDDGTDTEADTDGQVSMEDFL